MMLIRYAIPDDSVHIGLHHDGVVKRLPVSRLADVLSGDLGQVDAVVAATGQEDQDVRILAPVDGATEVWAAGVTYQRSRDARVEESQVADPYQLVYSAQRPELFFKSVAWRVSGPGEPVAIRTDSTLDVPEPELALAVTASGDIAGYTVCNDVSSRSIEGENPLYLPQAKVYAGSCALGPGIVLAGDVVGPARVFEIEMEIKRDGRSVWTGSCDTGRMVRPPQELVRWLYAGQDFPAGAILSTGTGIVPDLEFTLDEGDQVTIRIVGVGTLTNNVVRGKDGMAGHTRRRVAAGLDVG